MCASAAYTKQDQHWLSAQSFFMPIQPGWAKVNDLGNLCVTGQPDSTIASQAMVEKKSYLPTIPDLGCSRKVQQLKCSVEREQRFLVQTVEQDQHALP